MEVNIDLRIHGNNTEELQKWIDFIVKQKEHNFDCTLNVVVENPTYQDFLESGTQI